MKAFAYFFTFWYIPISTDATKWNVCPQTCHYKYKKADLNRKANPSL